MPKRKSQILFAQFPKLARVAGFGITPEFLHLGVIEAKSSYTYPVHRHDRYELIVTDRADYRCRLNQEVIDLRRGDVLVIKPGDLHEDLLTPPVRYYAISMDLKTAAGKGSAAFFADSVTARQQVCRLPPSRELAAELQQEGLRHDAVSAPLQDALLTALFWRLVRAFQPASISPVLLRRSAQQELLLALERCFRQNISRSPAVEEMAAALGMSPRSLMLKCQALLHTSPAKGFKQFQMNYAQTMLQQTQMPIKEISHHLGFTSQFHFSRVFKHYHGKPPSALR